ncbi:hypothetical protein FEM48_Zijuj01G0138000 [Ziziphus jujuba var. spinosa]|uniref:Uncharacterized protein n=1 Tax=Ziziphus jujuba var. spinosa TaxID=714518 RepID=A0A978W1M2_ZIZJJ|nr:hypothetical protein FEM48_Zijuj01G0138000 [Ziziphus jujuba var. spinosa]
MLIVMSSLSKGPHLIDAVLASLRLCLSPSICGKHIQLISDMERLERNQLHHR